MHWLARHQRYTWHRDIGRLTQQSRPPVHAERATDCPSGELAVAAEGCGGGDVMTEENGTLVIWITC